MTTIKKIPVTLINSDVEKALKELEAGGMRHVCCPISQCFRRLFPSKKIATTNAGVSVTNGNPILSICLPKRALKAMKEFDENNSISNLPLSFSVEFRAEDLASIGV